VYNLKVGVDDPTYKKKFKVDDEYQKFYDAVEPRQAGEDETVYLFDDAQREEDQEISYVPKSHPSKRSNSIPTPIHHKDFVPKKSKKYKNIAGRKNSQDILFREEGQGYGLIISHPSARNAKLYSYTSGKLNNAFIMKNNKWVQKLSVVLYRDRPYQKNKVDIIYVYNEDERMNLITTEELPNSNFFNIIPNDLLQKIYSQCTKKDFTNTLFINKQSKIFFDSNEGKGF